MMLIFVASLWMIESDHPYCDCGKAAVSASLKFMQQDGITQTAETAEDAELFFRSKDDG